MKVLNWKTTKQDTRLIIQIMRRAMRICDEQGLNYPALECDMDLTACHLNCCELQLEQLLNAPDFDFCHDVFGIRRHINRQTGQLEDCFVPRYAVGEMSLP